MTDVKPTCSLPSALPAETLLSDCSLKKCISLLNVRGRGGGGVSALGRVSSCIVVRLIANRTSNVLAEVWVASGPKTFRQKPQILACTGPTASTADIPAQCEPDTAQLNTSVLPGQSCVSSKNGRSLSTAPIGKHLLASW